MMMDSTTGTIYYYERFRKYFINIVFVGILSTALLLILTSPGNNRETSLFQIPRFSQKKMDMTMTLTTDKSTKLNVPAPIQKAFQHPKWIVLACKFCPTKQIRQLGSIPGWQLLIVAARDSEIRSNWRYSHPNTIYLSTASQSKLGYAVFKYLPYNSNTRKTIGYLYAMQHGAKYIYDMDEDGNNAVFNDSVSEVATFFEYFELNETTRGLVLFQNNNQNPTVVNPYAHFGQPTVWPRGFPLDKINQSYNRYTACTLPTPIIQQGLVNGEPDIDAILRLTRKTPLNSSLNVKFDEHAPPLILPTSVMAPFNSQNTLFHYKAFWGLLLPTSVSARVADIWRGYWAQPLLWRIGGTLGFYPPRHTTTSTQQQKSAQNLNFLKDFGEEDKLYKEAGILVKFLENWSCPSSKMLFECMVKLTTVMAELRFWSPYEIQLVRAWISDLKLVGYREPAFVQVASPCLKDKPKNFAMFSPAEADDQCEQFENSEMKQFKKHRIALRKFCKFPIPGYFDTPTNRSSTYSNNKSRHDPNPPSKFPKTLLVVEFNHPHYEHIWLLDSIYRPHFPNILYCGDLNPEHRLNRTTLHTVLARKEFVAAKVQKLSFVNAMVTSGVTSYDCGLRALDFKYTDIEGYLVVSDDVLFNFWNNDKLDPTQAWSSCPIAVRNIDDPYEPTEWNGWDPSQYPHIIEANKLTLKRLYLENETNAYWRQFRQNRGAFGYTNTTAIWAYSDLFYFPESKQEMFYSVASMAREYKLHLEIEIPFLMTGLSTGPEKLVNLTGNYIWGSVNRSRTFDFFDPSDNFIHPLKPSLVVSNSSLRRDFCEQYVARVLALGSANYMHSK